MPRNISFDPYGGGVREVATEKELLDFANKVRQAGGADIIEALLPSRPADTRKCLIANALNFSCRVKGYRPNYPSDEGCHWGDDPRESRWAMYLPVNMDPDRAEAIGREADLEYDERQHCFPLPRHIGNAAAAFDAGVAFQRYAHFGLPSD